MFQKNGSRCKLLLLIVHTVMVSLSSMVYSLRSPYYLTGKYTATVVDTGKWMHVKTVSNVSIKTNITCLYIHLLW